MSESCNLNCADCKEACNDKKSALAAMKVPPNQGSNIKHIIGVVSGKGGVGKTMVTSLLATAMNKRGYKTAILDADITGPSIPQAFGITHKATSDGSGIYPVSSAKGIKVISINLLLENTTDAVIWRGPLIAGAVKQFWTDVSWGDIDYMFVDMPPGTGDVPLTVFQSLPLDGVIIVTSPQQLVSMIVEKAVKMAKSMFVPILGLVENMSYFACPDCGKKVNIFGKSEPKKFAKNNGINEVALLPIDPQISAAGDQGSIEDIDGDWLDSMAASLEKLNS